MCNLPRFNIPTWMKGPAARDIVAEASPLVEKIQSVLSSIRPMVARDDTMLTWQLACAIAHAAMVLRGSVDRNTPVFTEAVPHLKAISDWLVGMAETTRPVTMIDALVAIGHVIIEWRSGRIEAAKKAVESATAAAEKMPKDENTGLYRAVAEAETTLMIARAEERLISALIGRLGKTVARILSDFIGDQRILTEGLDRQQEELIGEVRKPFAAMLQRREAA